jgi:predicted amidophosphoribosyltransferase
VFECRACGEQVEAAFRFCPWCAAPTRRKLVEFFPSSAEEPGRALRVSRYLDERHVRFSVWDETGRAEAAVSISEQEAARLAGYLEAGSEAPTLS